MNYSYQNAKNKYQNERIRSLDAAHNSLPEFLLNKEGQSILKDDIAFTTINYKTYEDLKKWEYSGKRVAEWDWNKVRDNYRNNPKRFEVAIWYRKHFLSGASIGKPTKTKHKIMLDFIEANPLGSPLSGLITDMVILCGQVYGKAIGASEIRIMNPINERVRDHYLSKPGFEFNEKDNYCYRSI